MPKEENERDMVLARCEYALYLRERGMTYRTVAERLGVTPARARERVNRALFEQKRTAFRLRHMLPTVREVARLTEELT